MTYDELESVITRHGLSVIAVKEYVAREEDFTFAGDLDAFLLAARKIGATGIFVARAILKDGDFSYYPEEPGETDEEGRPSALPESLDLCDFDRTLRHHLPHVGQDGSFRLAISVQGVRLNLFLSEPWWDGLLDRLLAAREKARERYDDLLTEAADRREADVERREDTAIEKLRGLIEVPDFYRLTTIRAMRAYALGVIPELASVRPSRLSQEVELLDAQIKMKGLRRKR